MENEWGRYKFEVGGRCLDDIEQIAFSLKSHLGEDFPINEVPTRFVERINKLIDDSQRLKLEFERFIDDVKAELEKMP